MLVARIEALATLYKVIAGRKVEWVSRANLTIYLGRLRHTWMLRLWSIEQVTRA